MIDKITFVDGQLATDSKLITNGYFYACAINAADGYSSCMEQLEKFLSTYKQNEDLTFNVLTNSLDVWADKRLMTLTDPSHYYIWTEEAGTKHITELTDKEIRLVHSLDKMYKSGVFSQEKKHYDKDFYDELPGCICEILDSYIANYSSEGWFDGAWEEYRQHVLNASLDDMKMPSYVFGRYIEVK